MQRVKFMLGFLALVYVGVLGLAWVTQRDLVYRPDPRPADPGTVGIAGIEERWITAPDGVRVVAWYGRAKNNQPTVLYFHGNAGNLALRSERIQRFMQRDWGVYMMSYRGYSGSGGHPSETDNVADARRAYADLVALGVTPRDIVMYGESLGTGVATQLAVDTPSSGLILDSPFTSIVEIGAGRYPFLPVSWLLDHRYETIKVIGRVTKPLLVVHGEADPIVPVEMGRRVFAAAERATPKRLLTFPGAGHSNHYRFGSFDAIAAFVDQVKVRAR